MRSELALSSGRIWRRRAVSRFRLLHKGVVPFTTRARLHLAGPLPLSLLLHGASLLTVQDDSRALGSWLVAAAWLCLE